MLAALDLGSGQMTYRIRERKRWREFLALLKLLRSRWPAGKLYVICDNFSPHKHPAVTSWAAGHNTELVFLPTYSSWLNSRLSHFWPGRGLPSGAGPRSSVFPAGSDIGNRAQGSVGVARTVTVVHTRSLITGVVPADLDGRREPVNADRAAGGRR
jgi:DDE superfamily endonuclease